MAYIPVHTFFAPNSFTPNDDGLNDVFQVNASKIKEFEILIYNRWGELLFHADGYQQDWDGTYQGKDLPVGTYYYIIDSRNVFFCYAVCQTPQYEEGEEKEEEGDQTEESGVEVCGGGGSGVGAGG